ncbi:MAG: FeoB-associated Cys-rich membrane protein [Pirellulaceae bacterium]|nr:hypothetical protein [Planctomycetales bacterium]
MGETIQNFIVACLITIAVTDVVRRLWRLISQRNGVRSCTGCTGCPADNSQVTVSVHAITPLYQGDDLRV